jgi:hypothetical protein
MSRNTRLLSLALLGACASAVLASAQATSSPTEVSNSTQASSSPVAYVYVSKYVSSINRNEINVYSAASNGSLTAISGSPFHYNINRMVVNGASLFGVDQTLENIDSFSIGSNGALTLKDVNAATLSGGGIINLNLDHTGASLYADYYTTNNDYLSYSIDNATGELTSINDLAGGPENADAVSFVGNNQFAYSSNCYHFAPAIYGEQRAPAMERSVI